MMKTKPTSKSGLHNPAHDTILSESQARLTLEICRGCTEFPFRPVTGRRFLIGGGISCDLRLGGDEIPSLHSLLFDDGGQIVIEAIVQTPPLRINGQTVEQAEIEDGDVIEIGTFRLLVHLAQNQQTSKVEALMPNYDKIPHNIDDNDLNDIDLSELSAAELIEKIENEQAMIDAFEGRRQLGAEALLAAALERAHADDSEDELEQPTRLRMVPVDAGEKQFPAPQSADTILKEAEQLLLELNTYAQQVEDRIQQVAGRGGHSIVTSTELASKQNQIHQKLGELLQRAADALADDEPPHSFRIVA